MAGAPKGNKNNPKGRPTGAANKITKEAKQIIAECLDDLSPMLRAKFNDLEPKDWITLYCKVAEFVIPKAAPVDPTITNDELKTLMAMAAKEAAENV